MFKILKTKFGKNEIIKPQQKEKEYLAVDKVDYSNKDQNLREEENVSDCQSNLRELVVVKNSQKKLSEYDLKEICEYYNNQYSIKVTEDEKKYEEFSEVGEFNKWGDILYKDWADKIKNIRRIISEKKPFPFDPLNKLNVPYTALELYCGEDYKHVNSILRKVYCQDLELVPEMEKLSNILVFEILSAPRINKNIVLYRIIDSVAFELIMKEMDKNMQYKELGFMSTTMLREGLLIEHHLKDHNYMLKLFVVKGTAGVYSTVIAGRAEHEVVLLNSGILKPRKKPYFDEKLEKIVLECSYEDKKYKPNTFNYFEQ